MEVSDISAADLETLKAQDYTENDLAMLAPSEVAALLAVPKDDDASSADHDAAAAEQDAATIAAAKATATVEAEAKAEAIAAVDESPAQTPFVLQYKVEVPADAKEQIETLKGEEKSAFKRLLDGEIESDVYQEVKARTEAAVDALKEAAMQANIFEKANQQNIEQNARNDWNKAETAAFAGFKADGLNYKDSPSLLAAYNVNLKAIGADPKNEKRDAPWFLAEAHRMTKEAIGFVAKPGVKINKGGTPNRVDLSDLPPTLRSVPVAATGAVNGDEFAHMRTLEGLELERAHARLTNEQRDRWMAE